MTSVHTRPPEYVLAYRIVVYGSPAPQGSKAFKGMRPGKNGRMIANLQESSKAVKPWREAVKFAALEARYPIPMNAPIEGPIACRMVFTMPKPGSRPKTRKTWCTSAPDLSKLQRSTEDALTDAGIWVDDSRVVEYLRAAKVFLGEDPEALDCPGCIITIYRIQENAP